MMVYIKKSEKSLIPLFDVRLKIFHKEDFEQINFQQLLSLNFKQNVLHTINIKKLY